MPTLVELFHRDGFTILPDLVPAANIASLKADCQRILAEHAPGRSVYVGASGVSPLCRQAAHDRRLVDLLANLLPGGVAFLSDKVVVKDGSNRFPTPWHQDAAYWPNTRIKISVWIALDTVTEANGALRVVPGSHRRLENHLHDKGGHVRSLRRRDQQL